MVNSHVCFLVIDGAEFKRHGETYLRAHLAHMTNEIANLLRQTGSKKKITLSKIWYGLWP